MPVSITGERCEKEALGGSEGNARQALIKGTFSESLGAAVSNHQAISRNSFAEIANPGNTAVLLDLLKPKTYCGYRGNRGP